MKTRYVVLLLIASLLSMSAGAAVYDIHVAGVQVTDANKNDVLGNGKVRFDSNSNKMTLSGLQTSVEDTFLIIGKEYKCPLQLVCNQVNKIHSTSGISIVWHSAYKLIITGSLEIDGILTYSQLQLTDASVQAFGTDKEGQTTGIVSVDISKRPLALQHSNITQSYISGFGWMYYTACELITPDVTYNNTTMRFEDAQGNMVDKVDIRSYEIYAKLGDIEITSKNYGDPLGDGTLKYNHSNKTFSFSNLEYPDDIFETTSASSNSNLYIFSISGHNSLMYMYCLNADNTSASVHFTGTGELHLGSPDFEIPLAFFANMRISGGCHLILDGMILSMFGGTLTIENSSLVINRAGSRPFMDNLTQINLIGSKIVYPEGAVWDSNLKTFTLNGVEVTDRIEIAPINTAIAEVKEDIPTGPAYDVLGRPVDANYRGIVIRDGKKFLYR